MFISIKKVTSEHTRKSKLGFHHTYYRTKTIASFKCDNCNSIFDRDIGKIDSKRLTEHSYHVCSNCNSKKFAQSKGVESRRLWNLPVDSDIKINNL